MAVVVDLEDERLGELGPDVERRAGGQRLRRRRAARSGARRPSSRDAPFVAPSAPPRSPSSAAGRPSRRVPLPWAISGRPPPLPSMRGARRRGRGRRPTMPRADEVVADRHEQLRLVGVEAERDDAGRRATPRRSLADALQRVDRVERPGEGDEANARVATSSAAPRARPARGRPPRRAPALSRRFVSRSSSWSAAIRSGQRLGRLARRPPRPPARGRRRRAPRYASAPAPVSASIRRMPDADAPLAGDDEAADLAGRPAVRAAAQLVAVALDPDGPDRLAVLLVEERVGAGVDRLGHRHERGRHRPVLADDPADLGLDRRAARRRSAPRSNGKSNRR